MRLTGSDLRLLQVFDAVARHGAFAAAEAELNIGASTISNHMTALEERLGVKLCQRGRSGFRLTEKGELVLGSAQRLFKAIGDFDAETSGLKGTLAGELRIGLVDSIATDPNSKMSEAIARFDAGAGAVTLAVMQDRPQDLQQKVHDGEYHCGIGSFPHLISGLEAIPLYEERHLLYAACGHPVLDPSVPVSVGALKKHPFIRRGYWRDADEKRLMLGPVAATVHQIEPQLMLIRSGRYLGFLPEHYARHWVDAGALAPVLPHEINYTCTFSLILRKGYRRTETLRTFLEDLVGVHGVSLQPPAKRSAPEALS